MINVTFSVRLEFLMFIFGKSEAKQSLKLF